MIIIVPHTQGQKNVQHGCWDDTAVKIQLFFVFHTVYISSSILFNGYITARGTK